MSYEAFQLIIQAQARALVSLGADPQLEVVAFNIMLCVARKLYHVLSLFGLFKCVCCLQTLQDIVWRLWTLFLASHKIAFCDNPVDPRTLTSR